VLKELDGPKEPASNVAERKWRNHSISERFKKLKTTGEGADDFFFYDGKKPFSAEVPKPPKEAQPAEVIENNSPKAIAFERKFKRDIRIMLKEHKEMSVTHYRAILRHQKRRLLMEKYRRYLVASIAQREGAVK
jgi:hypothetical protein